MVITALMTKRHFILHPGGSHPFLRDLVHLPNLERLDLYFFTYKSTMQTYRGDGDLHFNALYHMTPLLVTPARYPHREQEEMELLLTLLRQAFGHVKSLNLWRSLDEAIVNNQYEKLDF